MPILPPRMGLKIMQGDNPTFYRDFAFNKTLNHGIGPNITFTRTGTATYFDATGTLTTATANTPRFDHDPVTLESRGLLIEESRTNSIRNSQAGGSTNGVIGSSGVMPTNWLVNSITGTGISYEVIGTGILNGFNYIDVKISGTNTSGSTVNAIIYTESFTQVVALQNQTWTSSGYIALVNGSFSGTSNQNIEITERTSAGSFIGSTGSNISTSSASLQRFSATRTFSAANAARAHQRIITQIADSNSCDFTLRIAAPQLEQGSFATSYIPTTNAPVS